MKYIIESEDRRSVNLPNAFRSVVSLKKLNQKKKLILVNCGN